MLDIVGLLIIITGLIYAFRLERKKKKGEFNYNMNFGIVVTVLGLIILGIGIFSKSAEQEKIEARQEYLEQQARDEEKIQKQRDKIREDEKNRKEFEALEKRLEKEKDEKKEKEEKEKPKEETKKEKTKESEPEISKKNEDKMTYNAALTRAQAWKEKVMFGVFEDLCTVNLDFDAGLVEIKFNTNNSVDGSFYSGSQDLWDEQKTVLAGIYNELVTDTDTQFQMKVYSQTGELMLEVYGPNNVVDHFSI